MKILIVRFSSIGDVVLTTPILRCVKSTYPEVELHYLTKKNMKELLINNPHVDQVHTIERSIKEVLPKLRAEKFDYLIDLHHNIRTLQLKFGLGIKTYAFPKLNWEKWLLVRFKINKLPEIHVVDRYFETVKPLKVHSDKLPGELFLAASDEVNTTTEFNLGQGSFVSIAIGAQFSTKQLPLEKLKAIINEINDPIVLVGGRMDQEKGNQLVKMCPTKRIVNSCGKYTLLQSASIVKQSNVLLTNDTGMMHIAACFGVRIVSVWGNTVPALGMYPYLPLVPDQWSKHEVELNCRPCSKIGFKSCPKGHFNCMNQQNVHAISTDINQS